MQARALGKYFEQQGLQCAGVDDPESEFIKDRVQAVHHWPKADVIFVEYPEGVALTVEPGDTVIKLQTIQPTPHTSAPH